MAAKWQPNMSATRCSRHPTASCRRRQRCRCRRRAAATNAASAIASAIITTMPSRGIVMRKRPPHRNLGKRYTAGLKPTAPRKAPFR